MLPKDFLVKRPIAFDYWEKGIKQYMKVVFEKEYKPFFILISKAIPEPFVVGSN